MSSAANIVGRSPQGVREEMLVFICWPGKVRSTVASSGIAGLPIAGDSLRTFSSGALHLGEIASC